MNPLVVMGLLAAGLAVAVAIALLMRRSRFGGRATSERRRAGRRFLPSSAPAASRGARLVDAAVLSAVAAAVFTAAVTQSTAAWMLPLDELPPRYVTANIIIFAVAVAGAAVAVLITLLGRTVTGTVAMAAVLIGYGLVLNSGKYPGSWFISESVMAGAVPVVEYTIAPANVDIPGAELWVNGAYLGKLPYKTTLSEFAATVPAWTQPPADYAASNTKISHYELSGVSTGMCNKWIRFKPPPIPNFGKEPTTMPECYAQVRYAGEWAVAGGSSGSGRGGNKYRQKAESHFDVILPQRARRLGNLLSKARLADYRVDEQWLKAIETYGRDGWSALHAAAANEAEMKQMLVAWATWRHGLDAAVDAESAWQVFEDIGAGADAAGCYSTDSIAGLAVELLMPKLSPERIVASAEETIRRTKNRVHGYSHGQTSGRTWFATSTPPEGSIPPRVFVLAHAVWKLNERLESTGGPNIVQERVVPALICWTDLDKAAVSLGGQAAYTWLVRHDWRTPGDVLWSLPPFRDTEWVNGTHVNRGLYELAHFRGPLGREFRWGHADDLMRLADEMLESKTATANMTPPSFLFMDLDRGKESVAARYWPNFRGHAAAHAWRPLEPLWSYLVRMEPVSTAEQYVEAWRSVAQRPSDKEFAMKELAGLAPPKRREVIAAIRAEVEHDPQFARGGPAEVWRGNIVNSLERQLPDDDHARVLLGDLAGKNSRNFLRNRIGLWLEHTRPDHPLVELLAGSEDPAPRLLAMGALRAHPTPQHRRLLERLLADPVPSVRDAAKSVQAHLKALAAESPARYASEVPAS